MPMDGYDMMSNNYHIILPVGLNITEEKLIQEYKALKNNDIFTLGGKSEYKDIYIYYRNNSDVEKELIIRYNTLKNSRQLLDSRTITEISGRVLIGDNHNNPMFLLLRVSFY